MWLVLCLSACLKLGSVVLDEQIHLSPAHGKKPKSPTSSYNAEVLHSDLCSKSSQIFPSLTFPANNSGMGIGVGGFQNRDDLQSTTRMAHNADDLHSVLPMNTAWQSCF